MRYQRKPILGGLVMTALLFLLATACDYPAIAKSPYLQDVVPAQQEPAFWYLSPMGDKLLYDTSADREQAMVRFLATGQELAVPNCSRSGFRWLDNQSIYCYSGEERFIVTVDISSNTDDFRKTFLKGVTAEQMELDRLVEQASAIYRLQPLTEPDTLLILNTETVDQNYHITGIKNLDEVLENYAYTTIPLFYRRADLSKKVYSPDGNYYHLLQNNHLGIYEAATDQMLIEFTPPSDYKSYVQIGGFFPNQTEGWAADNSGVYFQIFNPSGFGPPPPIRPIQKLCVPDASGCAPAK